MMKGLTYLCLINFALVSCSHSVAPTEYVKYVENRANGLKIQKEYNGVEYVLQYEPTEYCVMLEKRSFTIPKSEFEAGKDHFKGLEHYTLKIQRSSMDSLVSKLGDTSKYKKSITEYFDFGIQKDIKLIEGRDTVPCSICQCDANTGISQYYTFSLGFSTSNSTAKENSSDHKIEFCNKILNTGTVDIVVSEKDLKNLPSVKMM